MAAGGIENLLSKQELRNFILSVLRQEGVLPASSVLKMLAGGSGIVEFGTGTLTFTASATSNQPIVSHGLGVVPVALLPGDNGGVAWCHLQFDQITSKSFRVTGHDTGGAARTGQQTYSWMALA